MKRKVVALEHVRFRRYLCLSQSRSLSLDISFVLKTPGFWCQYRFRYITYFIIYTYHGYLHFCVDDLWMCKIEEC